MKFWPFITKGIFSRPKTSLKMKIFASVLLTFLCLQIGAVDAIQFWVKPVNHSFAIGILCWNSESTGLISTGWAFRQAEITRVEIRPNLAECHGDEAFIRVESLQNASIKVSQTKAISQKVNNSAFCICVFSAAERRCV